jgi:hypothetical protein
MNSLLLPFLLCILSLLFWLGASDLFLANFAGSGTTGYNGENLPRTEAEMSPHGLW